MSTSGDNRPVLDESTAQFILRYVSMNLATRNDSMQPAVTRVFGCRVSEDRRSVTLFITRACNQAVLSNIESTGVLAVVFSRPSTHETVQLKGKDARLVQLLPEDREFINRYRQSMIDELLTIGYPAAFTESMIPPPEHLDVAICFTPQQAFSQTPGPKAGLKLTS